MLEVYGVRADAVASARFAPQVLLPLAMQATYGTDQASWSKLYIDDGVDAAWPKLVLDYNVRRSRLQPASNRISPDRWSEL